MLEELLGDTSLNIAVSCFTNTLMAVILQLLPHPSMLSNRIAVTLGGISNLYQSFFLGRLTFCNTSHPALAAFPTATRVTFNATLFKEYESKSFTYTASSVGSPPKSRSSIQCGFVSEELCQYVSFEPSKSVARVSVAEEEVIVLGRTSSADRSPSRIPGLDAVPLEAVVALGLDVT